MTAAVNLPFVTLSLWRPENAVLPEKDTSETASVEAWNRAVSFANATRGTKTGLVASSDDQGEKWEKGTNTDSVVDAAGGYSLPIPSKQPMWDGTDTVGDTTTVSADDFLHDQGDVPVSESGAGGDDGGWW